MLQSIQGVYKDGKIELAQFPSDVSESRVIVTFLESNKAQVERQIMQFGMFSGKKPSTEEDLEIAEFKGDTEDGLDWSYRTKSSDYGECDLRFALYSLRDRLK